MTLYRLDYSGIRSRPVLQWINAYFKYLSKTTLEFRVIYKLCRVIGSADQTVGIVLRVDFKAIMLFASCR